MSQQQKADWERARERAEDAWQLWIKTAPVSEASIKTVFAQGFYEGVLYGRAQAEAD